MAARANVTVTRHGDPGKAQQWIFVVTYDGKRYGIGTISEKWDDHLEQVKEILRRPTNYGGEFDFVF